MAQYHASPNVLTKLFDADAAAAPVNSRELALHHGLTRLVWQTSFASAPAAVSVELHVSNDGVNWVTIDSSTNVNGEQKALNDPQSIVVFMGPWAYIRARKASQTGGGALTVSFRYHRTL